MFVVDGWQFNEFEWIQFPRGWGTNSEGYQITSLLTSYLSPLRYPALLPQPQGKFPGSKWKVFDLPVLGPIGQPWPPVFDPYWDLI
jgi:hypothetical protein